MTDQKAKCPVCGRLVKVTAAGSFALYGYKRRGRRNSGVGCFASHYLSTFTLEQLVEDADRLAGYCETCPNPNPIAIDAPTYRKIAQQLRDKAVAQSAVQSN